MKQQATEYLREKLKEGTKTYILSSDFVLSAETANLFGLEIYETLQIIKDLKEEK